MKKILCYIYEGMADFEISLLLHRLRNTGGREIVAISEDLQQLTAQSGLQYVANKTIDEIVSIKEYEALIIPGGPINNEQNSICRIVKDMANSEKLIATICFGSQFLGRAGILDNYLYTTSCSSQKIKQIGCTDPFNRQNYVDKRFVVDKNLITAQGYAFVDFAIAVCDYLNIFEDEKQRYDQLERIKEN